MKWTPKWRIYTLVAVIVVTVIILASTLGTLKPGHSTEAQSQNNQQSTSTSVLSLHSQKPRPSTTVETYYWATLHQNYPVTSYSPLPTPVPSSIPRIQATFKDESSQDRNTRLQRQTAVKNNFTHAWNGYRKYAWLRDEVMPLSGRGDDPFGHWAATLVDSLDTLWIMGLQEEFENAVNAADRIDFTNCTLDEVNTFETTIRFLGGFLGAYDVSGAKYPVLLKKAEEVGAMLYKAFDTPNRMPITRWKINGVGARGIAPQEALDSVIFSEVASFTVEFTRLSQLTGNPRYYDAVQRVMDVLEAQQMQTNLPGLWPVLVNTKTANFTDSDWFTISGGGDSAYEYLPKQHILLGGATDQYRKLYGPALEAMQRSTFYRPMTPDNRDILFPGQVTSDGKTPLDQLQATPQTQHLTCFSGGMVGLAARVFGHEDQMSTAQKLVEGCLWGYEAMGHGVFPDGVEHLPCDNAASCSWDEQKWLAAMNKVYGVNSQAAAESKLKDLGLTPGVMSAPSKAYWLRPEAIESAFIHYRLTGDRSLQDRVWNIFNTLMSYTITDIAHASLLDCTVAVPPKIDNMQSFWLAETMKYFYLIFSEPDLISLDEYVLNTEAHPLKRPI